MNDGEEREGMTGRAWQVMTAALPCPFYGYCLKASMTDPAALWFPAYAGMTVRNMWNDEACTWRGMTATQHRPSGLRIKSAMTIAVLLPSGYCPKASMTTTLPCPSGLRIKSAMTVACLSCIYEMHGQNSEHIYAPTF